MKAIHRIKNILLVLSIISLLYPVVVDAKPRPTKKPTRKPVFKNPVIKHDKPVAPPTSDSSKNSKDVDSNGCCLSCGEFWCQEQNKCVTDWGNCQLGKFDEQLCSYQYTAAGNGG
jgi:hypothetical protein